MLPAADLIFVNGPVFTADPARPWARTVAVAGGRIVAIDAQPADRRGPATEVVDLAGRLLTPGFIDAHVHPAQAGLERLRCDLSEVHTRAGYLATVRKYAEANPDEPWIVGGGWAMDQFPGGQPDRRDLDAVVPDRPVFLPNRDHHAAWVNSRALARAGIDAGTPDPPDGRIERDPAGRPTGMLQEGAAGLVARLIPALTDAQLQAGLMAGQQALHGWGVTGWQDAIVGDYDSMPDTFDTYLQLQATGRLTGRAVGALWWDRTRDLDQLDGLKAKRDKARRAGGRFVAGSVKMMLDGVCETRTASLHDPYLPVGEDRGVDFIDPGRLAGYVTALDAEGFQVHFHAIGDRAITNALDAVEEALRVNGFREHRHHIAHVQLVRPADIGRFRALRVTATVQALWACNEPQQTELTLPLLGPARALWQYPFGDFVRAGVDVAYGSDWPVSTADPWQAIHVAVNRTEPPTADHGALPVNLDPFLPQQRVDLTSALNGYTRGSARVCWLDRHTGTIEVGKAADLVIHSRNPFAGPIEEIGYTRAERTFVDGSDPYR
jgi:predicted amidohydrolase YtcJ